MGKKPTLIYVPVPTPGGIVLAAGPGAIILSGKAAALRIKHELPPPGVLRFGRTVYLIPGRL